MSLIQVTGRDTRFKIFFVGICAGGLIMFFGGGYLSLLGLGTIAAFLVFGWYAISCPQCNNKWLLYFMRSSKSSDWLHDLYSMEKCPKCNYVQKP